MDESKERFDDKSVLIVSARLDAINLFDKLEFGFDSPSLGIVTLLAAVQILNQNEKFKGLYYIFLFEFYLWTIPIIRQQKDWVVGSRKWPVLLTFSTVYMLVR